MGGGGLVADGVGGDGGARLVSRHIEDLWLSRPEGIFSTRKDFYFRYD